MRTQLIFLPDEINLHRIELLRKNQVKGLGIHPGGGADTCAALEDMLRWLEKEETKKLLDYAADAGMEIEYEIHAGGYLAPRSYFAEHPEYFREKDGRRVNDFNFCPSCEEMLEIVAQRAADLVKKLYRSTNRYYLWLDDVPDSRCTCPRCSAFSASDQNLLVMNRILKELRKTDPQAQLAYLAYYETAIPPRKVQPEPGIFLEYAPIERYKDRAYGDFAGLEEPTEQLQALWTVFDPKTSKILEYWYDNSLFSGWKKPPKRFVPDHEKIRKEIEWYRQLGCTYVSSFACYTGEDYIRQYGDPDFSALQGV